MKMKRQEKVRVIEGYWSIGLSDEEDNQSSEEDIEEDEIIDSRPLTPESEGKKIEGLNIVKKPILCNESKLSSIPKIPNINNSKNTSPSHIRGTFT